MVSQSAIKAIAFDLDGTLVDSVPDLVVAVQSMLAQLQLPPCTEQQVRNWVGNGAEKLVIRALTWASSQPVPPSVLHDALPLFMAGYQQSLNVHSHLYPGVAETIYELQKDGYRLAVVTNKPYKFALPIIESFGLKDCFSLVLGGDSLAKMKPDPLPLHHLLNSWNLSPNELLMVGDSKNDILAAKSAGISSIGLTYGYNYGEDIGLAGPDAVCEQFNDILSWLTTNTISEQ